MPRPELRWPGRTARAVPAGGGGAPLAPSQVTSITVDGGATVSWVNPGSGAAATGYTVTPYIAGVAQATTTVGAPATSASVTGLTNATAYTFSVHANNAAGSSGESAQSGANTPRLNLIFGDEFNGSYLDPHWIANSRDGDQSNTEQQYFLPANVSLDGASNLVILAKSQSVTLPGYNDANPPFYGGTNVTRSYTSGSVQWASFSFTYGKVQVSAKVPQGALLWPAIWMLGSNCQVTNPYDPDNVGTCGWSGAGSEECDIMELLGQDGTVSTQYSGNYYSSAVMGATRENVSAPATTYHTYEADWSAGLVTWLLDGVSWTTYSTSIAAGPMFLILQTAIQPGGTPSFVQPDLIVDWVRVFHN